MKRKIRKNMLWAMMMLLLCCNYTYAQNKKTENTMNELRPGFVQEAVIEIHTNGKEQYTARGSLEVRKNGEAEEQFLELQGELERKNNEEINEMNFKADGIPICLTVYEGENIYGFYSNRRIFINNEQGVTKVVMYGYLEAYYDGAVYYSG